MPANHKSSATKLRIGVLGLGMAGGIMVPVIANHSRTVIAGAADLNPGLRTRFSRDYDVEVNDDALALMYRTDIDAVYIATPHQFHKEHAIMAARHGKHIIVEKPMALSLEDCDAMIEAAERNNVVLIVGHTHSFDPAIRLMREFTISGELGRLAMIAMWNYTDFLYRPRRPEELDTSKGGGILFNQIPHQVDIARLVAGTSLRAVRAATGVLDPSRPTEGCCTAFLDFEGGVAATLVYSGYDHFDSDELHSWVSSTGRKKTPAQGSTRKALLALKDRDEEIKLRQERYGYGGGFVTNTPAHQPHFGLVVASYERGDLRLSADGLTVYSDDGVREVKIPPTTGGRTDVLEEFYSAVVGGVRPLHDGHFAKGTVEACLAILRSSRERREIVLERPAAESDSA
jgi:phthalate 4,5-cis-dihydrodiol dehydrogenase